MNFFPTIGELKPERVGDRFEVTELQAGGYANSFARPSGPISISDRMRS